EVPRGYNSSTFAQVLLEKTGIVVSPGVAFGDLGEGFVRFALVAPEERLVEAVARMKKQQVTFSGK
ncbi:LL-diaminopimelate aminotransferase, partial [Candidatus Margulisiibacteriota bacterium]